MKEQSSLKMLDVPKKVLEMIPARVASHYCVIPVGVEEGVLKLAVPHDMEREHKADIRVMLGFEPYFVSAGRSEIEEMILKCYGVGAGVIETLTEQDRSESGPSDSEDMNRDKDSTIITLVNELFLDALKSRASDIHIEPFEKSLRIRYRVDGLLRDARISDKIRVLAPNLTSRIKIMAKLDIGEKRLPQDGRIKIKHKTGELDLRVSVLPSSFGEAIVVRILKPLELLDLQDLGFDEKGVGGIRELLKKPHGVVLVTGPTGSGKTTTLYSCLRELNQVERKIITVEDPVEYKLPGIIQMQVSPKIDFTFSKALRAILRHDPDCIMIGEIRDAETAEIAIRSALTGHLVFSTLHTNDAPSAVTRLVEMGVEPYLVASALEAVIAQRLVRRRCLHCRGEQASPTCEKCGGTGFHGRVAISETMAMNEEIKDLVLEKKTGSVIRKAAVNNGMTSLYEDGLNKAKKGLTSQDEIRRIICQ
jgi:type II secretory ATPase GspE/PulE/Tfp pilus assembly ATPase PilB-like protein